LILILITRFATSLYYALIDKAVRNYIFGIGPYSVGSEEEDIISKKDLGIQELLTLQFRYTLYETILKLPESQKCYEMYNDSTQRHQDSINQIFKEYQEKIDKIKKNKNDNNNNDNNDDTNDDNTNNNTNDNTNDTNNNNTNNNNMNTNNNNTTDNDDDNFKSSKRLWSALVGVHIEDYNFLSK